MKFDWRAVGKYALVDGARMHYHVVGSGPPLLLIHGIVGSSAAWHMNIAELAKRSTVYVVDQINMGRSDRVPGIDATLAAVAHRLFVFMDAMGIERADVLGHSHGGAVAMKMATQKPERVAGLMLMAPINPHSKQSDASVRFYGTLRGKAVSKIAPYMPTLVKRKGLERMFGDRRRIPKDSLECHLAGLRTKGTTDHIVQTLGTFHADLQSLDLAIDRLADRPVLLVWGDRDDAVCLESARILHGRLRESELVIFETAGHLPFEEMPERFHAVVGRWLERYRAANALRGEKRRERVPGAANAAAVR